MRNAAPLIVCVLALFVLPACQARQGRVLAAVQGEQGPTLDTQLAQRARGAAVAMLASLSDEQRAKASRPIDTPLRKDWHFVPREREGLPLGEMDGAQKTLAHKLMQTALSDAGYLKATDIIWLESVLYEMSNKSPGRDPGKYALLVFGDPADEKAAWGWRLEGHHLSINLTYTPAGIGVTPLFFGTNPAVVQDGPLAGKRILADAHNLAVELAQSMSDEQRAKMMLKGKPKDIVTSPGREKSLGVASGLLQNEMSERQQWMLLNLMHAHLGNLELIHQALMWASASRVMEQSEDGVFDILFAWAGPIDADQPFYYRIYCPGFVIEYSCQGKNHVHCVIHDLTDPLQDDLLKKHLQQHDHE